MQEEELIDLYKSIKVDTEENSEVEKSTLRSLLVYNGVDRQEPQFFRYVNREMFNIKHTTISQKQFLRIFMNPRIDFNLLNEEEIADIFYLMDKNKNGSITADQFFTMYSQTENFAKLTADKQSQVRDSIKENFRKLTTDGSMTPLEFYKIIKYNEQ